MGIEQRRNGSLCLLLFDPGCPPEDMRRITCSDIPATALRSLRKVPSLLVHKQYQIVAVEGVLSPEEKRVSTSLLVKGQHPKIPALVGQQFSLSLRYCSLFSDTDYKLKNTACREDSVIQKGLSRGLYIYIHESVCLCVFLN